jgi:alanine dehydrogenase
MVARVKVDRKQVGLKIGIPCERGFQENRVAITPQGVALLVHNGHEVILERDAGIHSFFSDQDYAEAGAVLVDGPAEVYQCPVVVKVGPVPTEELRLLRQGQMVFSALHLPGMQAGHLKEIIGHKITGVAYEYLTDRRGFQPVVRSMSEIAGTMAILIASEYMSNQFQGRGRLLGSVTGVPPTRVVILGAGTVAEHATRTALGLGSEVALFDNSIGRLRRLQLLVGRPLYTSVIHPTVLAGQLAMADVAVGAMGARNGRTPMIVTEDMVKGMKPGAIIIDVSIDQGGCFESSRLTNHTQPVFEQHGVVHYGVPNIPSRVSQTASESLSNILTPILLEAGQRGGVESLLWLEQGLRAGVYCHQGHLTHRYLGETYLLPWTHLETLMGSGM